MKKLLYILAVVALYSCETDINTELDAAEEIMVVDAWITQKMERQEIRITRSQPYFNNSFPIKIANATVLIEDLNTGTQYVFQEGDSSYYWDPTGTAFGVIGNNYRLTVTASGETFEAFSKLGRVPPIDTIKFHYNEEDLFFKQEYYDAEFVATDPVGVGDTYWIKAWKNGVYLSKPSELNMAYDATFTAGQAIDGQTFILPIRSTFINPFDEIPDKENEFFPPYLVDDSVHIEIHSVDPLAFDFLFAVFLSTNRPGGFAELFSSPLANVTTNIKSVNENSTTNVAGFFNVAAVSSSGRRLTQEMADEVKLTGN